MSEVGEKLQHSVAAPLSLRKNGKNWHGSRKPFRPNSSLTPFAKRQTVQKTLHATKAKEAEMKATKQEARSEHIRKIKDRREKKAEKERWEKMEVKMHRKRVERLKRREKRNKLLNS